VGFLALIAALAVAATETGCVLALWRLGRQERRA
jgi:hypothetical protein